MFMPVILVVEDDAVIRELVTVVFRDEGFDVVEAQDAVEALEALENRGSSVVALFSDIHMPGSLDGLALASHARRVLSQVFGRTCDTRGCNWGYPASE